MELEEETSNFEKINIKKYKTIVIIDFPKKYYRRLQKINIGNVSRLFNI
jgi:hypothetical protein